MKKLISVICAVMFIAMFSVTCFAEGAVYSLLDGDMKVTRAEGEQISNSERVWKTVYGEVTCADMEHGELRYTVYLPESYDSQKEYPFLLYLHGGSIGYHRSNGRTPWTTDLGNSEYAESIANSIKDCIIFAPQAPGAPQEIKDAKSAYWSEFASGMVTKFSVDNSASSPYLRAVEKMMENFLEKGISHNGSIYTVDASRLYVAGHSMGGIGVYTILRDCPDMFAAALIGSGIGDPDSVDLWKSTPVRIVHGTKDATISYKAAEVMIEALKDYPNVEIVTLVNGDHNIKPYLYGANWDDGINENFEWMATKDRDKVSIEGNSSKHTYVKSALDIPENTTVKVFFDGEEVVFPDEQPFTNTALKMPGGSSYSASNNIGIFIPVRAISEAAGFQVSWDEETQTVTAKKGHRVSTFTLGGDCRVNGKIRQCQFKFPHINDRVFVSQYGVCHALDCTMRWDDINRVIYFYSKDKFPMGSDLSQGNYSGANTESAKYQDFYSIAEKAFISPGVQEDFVPGGIAYRKDTNQFYVAGFFNTERHSAIAIIDASTGKITAQRRLLDADGSMHMGKISGISVSDKDIYLTNGDIVQRIALANIDSTSSNEYLRVEENINLNLGQACTNSFVEIKDGYLWVGNYYKASDKSYNTKANESYGFLIKGYKFDSSSGRLAKNDKAENDYIPDILYSLDNPEAIQGMTVAGNYIITASSYSGGRSVIQIYDKTKFVDSGEKITLDGMVQIPVISLNCENKLNAMSYIEGVTEVDGSIYALFSSASIISRRPDNVTATDCVWKIELEKLIGSLHN